MVAVAIYQHWIDAYVGGSFDVGCYLVADVERRLRKPGPRFGAVALNLGDKKAPGGRGLAQYGVPYGWEEAEHLLHSQEILAKK